MSALQVLSEEAWHGAAIQANEHSAIRLRPHLQVGVCSSQWRSGRVANPNDVKNMSTQGVVLLDGLKQGPSPEVFVQEVTQRHRSAIWDFIFASSRCRSSSQPTARGVVARCLSISSCCRRQYASTSA